MRQKELMIYKNKKVRVMRQIYKISLKMATFILECLT